jgi:hypothetical protein
MGYVLLGAQVVGSVEFIAIHARILLLRRVLGALRSLGMLGAIEIALDNIVSNK